MLTLADLQRLIVDVEGLAIAMTKAVNVPRIFLAGDAIFSFRSEAFNTCRVAF
jgi:hypothetical protein